MTSIVFSPTTITDRPARSRLRARTILADEEGAAAVEFAMIALPLLTTFLIILELALMFWMGQAMDNAVEIAARKISADTLSRTAARDGSSSGPLRQEICSQIGALFNCDSVKIHLKAYETVGTASVARPVDPTTGTWHASFGTTSECPKDGTIVVLQAAAEFISFSGLSLGHTELANGNRVVQSAYTFRVQDDLGLSSTCDVR